MAITRITSAECAEVARVLERRASDLSIRLSASGELRAIITDLNWLGSFAPTDPQPDTAYRLDAQRALRAFPRYEQALRIARALLLVDDTPSVRDKTSILKDRFDRLISLDEQSQDVLFELEVAGRLAAHMVQVALDEPDIVIFPGTPGRIGLACKRPRRVERLSENLRRAAAQIRKEPPGIIVIGVEALLQRDNESGRPVVYTTPTPLSSTVLWTSA